MHQRVDPPEAGGTVEQLAAASATVHGLLADARMWALSDAEVLDGLDEAYRLATQAHTMALLLLAEADRRRLPEQLGAASTVAWLTATRRIRAAEAKRDLTLARLVGTGVWDGAGDAPVGGHLGRGL